MDAQSSGQAMEMPSLGAEVSLEPGSRDIVVGSKQNVWRRIFVKDTKLLLSATKDPSSVAALTAAAVRGAWQDRPPNPDGAGR